jgi:hypothetical protein
MDEDSIERVERKLYSRTETNFTLPRHRGLRKKSFNIEEQWKDDEPTAALQQRPPQKHSMSFWLLVLSGGFFLLSLLVAAYFLFSGSHFVSSENIEIAVQGPTTVEGGEELVLQIAVTNKNPVPMELADLIVEFPAGTRQPGDVSVELLRTREGLGTIEPGERVQKTVRAVLFGPENSVQDIHITVEYRVQDSNAIFYKEQSYQVTLSSSPVSITVEGLKEITSGQTLDLAVTVTSNSSNVIENVLLTTEYPFGFAFTFSEPNASFGNTTWELGDIQPGGKRVIKIRGTVLGENEEERVFRFSAGVQNEKDPTTLATAFLTILHDVVIKKPFLGIELALDGNTAPTHVMGLGEQARADIKWTNNLPDSIIDGEIDVRLTGSALNKYSVAAQRGFYRSVDNTIVWSRETYADLASITPSASGSVTFSFSSFDLVALTGVQNPEVNIEVTIRGKRLSDTRVPEEVESTITRKVKVETDLLLTSRAVYFSGPLKNVGPIPPKADVETSYTIIWTVSNSTNRVTGTKVVATLPSYMHWTGIVSPNEEQVSYNEVGGQVVWTIGDMQPGARKEVAFQVVLMPSISQIGSSPILVNEQIVSGNDSFTNTVVQSSKRELTTVLTSDPGFSVAGGAVIP